jgi:glycosyltransferase involved in cell wall biosynthesis
MDQYRIIHFVSGGGSGSTGMAVSLAVGHQHGSRFEPMVVFRRKKKRNPHLDRVIATERIHFREVCAAPKFQTIRQLYAIITEFQPQVFVAHGFSEHIWGRIAARLAKVPVIIQIEHNKEKYSPLRLWQSQYLLKFTDKLICVSAGVKKHLVKLGFNSDKIGVVYNGIAVEEFTVRQNPDYHGRDANIIMVARFARQKDHESLIRAAKILHNQRRPNQILLIGGGKRIYQDHSIALCHQLELDGTVQFLGQKSRPEIQRLLGQNRIFVLSTHHEGLPLALIEAMAAGCAVIASNVDGVSELIEHGKTGFLVPPRDPEALAHTMMLVLDNETAAAAIATAGRENAVNNFNIAKMVREYEKIFLNEINNKGLATCKRIAAIWRNKI